MFGVIEMQCFVNSNKEYVCKELAVGEVNEQCSPPYQIRRYLFKPPYLKKHLSRAAISANDYCTRRLHGLIWEEGDYEYEELPHILRRATKNFAKLATKVNFKYFYMQS